VITFLYQFDKGLSTNWDVYIVYWN
jgi:hypothetical protein